jgi:SAM-dependent methyltransferase
VVPAGRTGRRLAVRAPAGRLSPLAQAYSTAAVGWARGPERVYTGMAQLLVGWSPVPLAGRVVLDVGAGTGLAGRAAQAAGGHVLAVDLAASMLRAAAAPGVVADIRRLPMRTGAVGAVVAAFCLNHLEKPTTGFREARRVTEPGGTVLASSYGTEIRHPVRHAVDSALAAAGYRAPSWYEAMKTGPMAALSTPEGMTSVARMAGLNAEVAEVVIAFPELDPADLVAWRLGMAHTAPFVDSLPAATRHAVTTQALQALGTPPVLERRMIVLRAIV